MAIEKRYLTKRDADGKPVIGPDGKPVEDRNAPRYRVRIATRDPMTGTRRNVTVGTWRTKREAEAAEREAMTKQERGTLLDPSKTTVGELLAEWLRIKAGDLSSNSAKDYEIVVRRHLVPALGTVPIQKLTADHVQAQYDAWAAEGKSAHLIRGCHLRLRQALDWAIDRHLLYVNVAAKATPVRLPKPAFDVWNRDELTRFLHAVMHRPVLVRLSAKPDAPEKPLESRPDPLSPLWHLLALEGMRRGEGLGLRWRDIEWERGTAHIRQTVAADKANKGAAVILPGAKTKASSRTVKLTAETLQTLREHRKAQNACRLAAPVWEDNDLIVTTGTGAPVNPDNVSRSFQALVRAAGLRRIRVHDLRHTHATLLLRAGVPVKIVSERLGHTNIGVTLDTYSHVLPDMQDTAAAAIDELLTKAREA
jgi:integrase